MTRVPDFDRGESALGRWRVPQLPQRGRVLAILALVVLVVLVAIWYSWLEYVRPNEYGIKEVQIGLRTGIANKVYPPGLHMVVPFGVQRIHRLPRNVQLLELTSVVSDDASAAQGQAVQYRPPVKIQTSEGFYVDVDASIMYRITDPYLVVTKLGTGDRYLTQGILPKYEPVLKDALGKLTTEQFYNSPMRVEKAEEARDQLDAALDEFGIEVQEVLIRYFRYSDTIQENIEAKKLQDQLVFTNQSKARAAEQEKELNRVTKEGEMAVLVAKEEANAYKMEKEADTDLYVRKKQAEADLLVELAEAKRTQLRNEAMQELGADLKVAMAMADVLKGLEVIVLPSGGDNSVNPLDLGSVLATFGVTGESTQTPVPMLSAVPSSPSEDVNDLIEQAASAVGSATPAPATAAVQPEDVTAEAQQEEVIQ